MTPTVSRHPFEAWPLDSQAEQPVFSKSKFGQTAQSDLDGNSEDLRRSLAVLSNDLALDEAVFGASHGTGEIPFLSALTLARPFRTEQLPRCDAALEMIYKLLAFSPLNRADTQQALSSSWISSSLSELQRLYAVMVLRQK